MTTLCLEGRVTSIYGPDDVVCTHTFLSTGRDFGIVHFFPGEVLCPEEGEFQMHPSWQRFMLASCSSFCLCKLYTLALVFESTAGA